MRRAQRLRARDARGARRPEEGVEGDEGDHGRREQHALAQHGRHFGVQEEEEHRRGDDKVHLEECDRLRARARHDQRVLRVARHREDEDREEHHRGEREEHRKLLLVHGHDARAALAAARARDELRRRGARAAECARRVQLEARLAGQPRRIVARPAAERGQLPPARCARKLRASGQRERDRRRRRPARHYGAGRRVP